jgi:thiol-disulfide isomerase/thioredoxin
MEKRLKNILLIVAVVIIASIIALIELPDFVSDDSLDETPPGVVFGNNVGDNAIQFNLKTLDDVEVLLSDLKGKVVFINFWATWCPFCVDEMPDIQQVQDEFGDSLVVLGINRAESVDKQVTFLEDLGINIDYMLLQDPSDSISEKYGVRVMPTSYFLNQNGVIVSRHFGQLTLEVMRDAIEEAGLSGLGDVDPVEDPVDVMVTDGVKHTVPLDKILSGGPPKDGIPSIDNPKFISVEEAEAFLNDEDLVLGIEVNGEAKAYPRKILVWHEIVNDFVGEKPVAVTYCPLCFTGAAFERIISGDIVEFGVSGKLYNSDLVMYDRKTDSYWSQITGESIVGELAGSKLERLPLDTLEWKDWKNLHPNTKVLSTDTGFSRNYGSDPYTGYYSQDSIIFPVDNLDRRLHLKTIVYGIVIDGAAKAYPEEEVEEIGLINDVIGNIPVLVIYDQDSNVVRAFERTFENSTLEFKIEEGELIELSSETKWSFRGEGLSEIYEGSDLKEIIAPPHFWFAWAAFYPDTELFGE